MNLKDYLRALPRNMHQALAESCGTSAGHLRNVAYGTRPCSAILATSIERETFMSVTRKELLPDTWQLIWPELICTGKPYKRGLPLRKSSEHVSC